MVSSHSSPSIYPREICPQRHLNMNVYILIYNSESLGKTQILLLTRELTNCGIFMKWKLIVKSNELLTHATIWMNVKVIILNESRQIQNSTHNKKRIQMPNSNT